MYLGHSDGVPLLTGSLGFTMFFIYKFTTISLSITILFSYIQFSSNQYFLKAVAYACFMFKSFINFTYFGTLTFIRLKVTEISIFFLRLSIKLSC